MSWDKIYTDGMAAIARLQEAETALAAVQEAALRSAKADGVITAQEKAGIRALVQRRMAVQRSIGQVAEATALALDASPGAAAILKKLEKAGAQIAEQKAALNDLNAVAGKVLAAEKLISKAIKAAQKFI